MLVHKYAEEHGLSHETVDLLDNTIKKFQCTEEADCKGSVYVCRDEECDYNLKCTVHGFITHGYHDSAGYFRREKVHTQAKAVMLTPKAINIV
jgi:hypothetical protein